MFSVHCEAYSFPVWLSLRVTWHSSEEQLQGSPALRSSSASVAGGSVAMIGMPWLTAVPAFEPSINLSKQHCGFLSIVSCGMPAQHKFCHVCFLVARMRLFSCLPFGETSFCCVNALPLGSQSDPSH